MSAARTKPRDLFTPAENTGDLIRAFRKNFGISQTEMAALTGIAQANLSAIESGTKEIGAKVALKLSAVLGLSPEIILFPQGYQSEPEFAAATERVSGFLEMVGIASKHPELAKAIRERNFVRPKRTPRGTAKRTKG